MTVGTTQTEAVKESSYLTNDYSILAWVLAVDHKRLALLYLGTASLFLALGGLAAVALRLELLTPAADLMQNDIFKRTYTSHGFFMVFFGLLPVMFGVLGNFLVPLMIGARNVAFPRLNLAGFYAYLLGGLLMFGAIGAGGIDTGWVFYLPHKGEQASLALLLAGLSLLAASLAIVLLAVNFVVTIHKMRAPGLTWFRLPLFIWTIYAASLVILIGTPLLVVTLLLVLAEIMFEWAIFAPALGGDPVLFQHLFWFYGNQVTFVLLLPALGIICEIFSAFTHRRMFGYRVVVYAIGAIALLGFTSWPIHLVNSDIGVFTAFLGSFMSFLTIIPFTVIIFSLVATMFKADLTYNGPVLFAMGAILLILIAGISRTFLSTLVLAQYLQGTYFATAHWHYAVIGALLAALGGLHFWWPKVTGRLYSDSMARVAAISLFVATNLALFPQFVLGYLGMPQHIQWYPGEFAVWQIAASLGVSLLVVAFLLPLTYLIGSLFKGQSAGNNPWQLRGLEWEAATCPPIAENFVKTPVVSRSIYDEPADSSASLTPGMPVAGPSH
jgi:cytochrome c oxidase subunit 1